MSNNVQMREITIEELAARISRKRAELGLSGTGDVQPNSGRRRTESKRALLRNIALVAAERGEEPPFKANY
jgi:hypothetical protein|tara:strand:- start:13 stop:225 length:213 start_codon:yes stop_codon:yes gene_type:complete